MAFNLREIFKALADAEVDYVVVGGLAVLMHGYLRATADLDLAIGLSPRNAGRGMQALASSGLRPRLPMPIEAFADAAKREVWLQHRHMPVFPLWDPANPLRSVDVFIDEPIPSRSAAPRCGSQALRWGGRAGRKHRPSVDDR